MSENYTDTPETKECQHYRRFKGVFNLEPRFRGCLACAYEAVVSKTRQCDITPAIATFSSDKQETPRTDAVALKRVLGAADGTFTLEEVPADFARQLERELADMSMRVMRKAEHAAEWQFRAERAEKAVSAREDIERDAKRWRKLKACVLLPYLHKHRLTVSDFRSPPLCDLDRELDAISDDAISQYVGEKK